MNELEKNPDNIPVKDLKPFGQIVEGKEGISAARLAEALGVTTNVIKKNFKPVGKMKIPYYHPFDVYDLNITKTHFDEPEIAKARERKQKRAERANKNAAELRRHKCLEHLSKKRLDLQDLYKEIVNLLWSPAQEKELLQNELYALLPAMLWDALLPKEGFELEAEQLIANIIWACQKERTYKVNKEYGCQDEPLVLTIYNLQLSPEDLANEEVFLNVFLSGIRHTFFDDVSIKSSKWEKRKMSFVKLQKISSRHWNENKV